LDRAHQQSLIDCPYKRAKISSWNTQFPYHWMVVATPNLSWGRTQNSNCTKMSKIRVLYMFDMIIISFLPEPKLRILKRFHYSTIDPTWNPSQRDSVTLQFWLAIVPLYSVVTRTSFLNLQMDNIRRNARHHIHCKSWKLEPCCSLQNL
jgi:hypothetical protein